MSMRKPTTGQVVRKSDNQAASEKAEQAPQAEPISVTEARRYRHDFSILYENYIIRSFSKPDQMEWDACRRALLRACGAIITCDYQPPISRNSKQVAALIAEIVSTDRIGEASGLGGASVVPFLARRVRSVQRMESKEEAERRHQDIIDSLRRASPEARARMLIRWYNPTEQDVR